jgi:type II secretory pathway pseudopilin PulG
MKKNSGFSLLESVLAIGILATMLVQVINMHSNSLAISQTTMNNMKATWALRQAMGQLQYIIDVYGSKENSRFHNISVPWSADPEFTIKVATQDMPIEASRLLVSAFRIGTAFTVNSQEGEDSGKKTDDPADAIKSFAEQINSFVPKDLYRTVKLEVSWKQGEFTKSLDSGFFLIDSKSLKESGYALTKMADQLSGAGGGVAPNGGGNTP